MNSKFLKYLVAGALATTVALASPALAFRGGGGMGGGGMHAMGGGMGGGMHAMGGGMHAMGGGMHAIGGGMRIGGMGGGPGFVGTRFAGAPMTHAAFAPRFSGAAFPHHGFHHRFAHHRFHRFSTFAFIGAPYLYASYDSCWRRVWTRFGWQWVDVCGYYDY